jgi:hypothetical protein
MATSVVCCDSRFFTVPRAHARGTVKTGPGTGEALMRGETVPGPLPIGILQDVRYLFARTEAALGPVRFEWVHNGELAWIVQRHRGATESSALRVISGEAQDWVRFDVEAGLEALRALLAQFPRNTGIILKGRVGLTSHMADVIRKARVPAKIRH